MSLFNEINSRETKISVIGLGYVGMPLAIEFAKYADVIGFDQNYDKIELYKCGIDPTKEVGDFVIQSTSVEFCTDEKKLNEAKFHIVAVPTPINSNKTPNLQPLISASEIVGRNLSPGSIVVFESTVYPGVTEDICVPILEKESGLKCGLDFKVGYSPERINPGDKLHRLDNIVKIVSGMDEDSLNEISKIYEMIVKAGVHKASSIKVAEAAKVVENSQRDVNIAFMNELSIVFDKMSIDTIEVIEAMNTKWNALGFYPGLVGGHCIGVDPYYFISEAEKLGHHSQIILSARKINNGMGSFIADIVIKQLVLANKIVRKSKVVILGITFKENCPDIRNSKVEDIIIRLKEYGIIPVIVDPQANKDDVRHEYNIEMANIENVKDADCIVFAVAHKEFINLNLENVRSMFSSNPNDVKIIIDVKSILNKSEILKAGYIYWRL